MQLMQLLNQPATEDELNQMFDLIKAHTASDLIELSQLKNDEKLQMMQGQVPETETVARLSEMIPIEVREDVLVMNLQRHMELVANACMGLVSQEVLDQAVYMIDSVTKEELY